MPLARQAAEFGVAAVAVANPAAAPELRAALRHHLFDQNERWCALHRSSARAS